MNSFEVHKLVSVLHNDINYTNEQNLGKRCGTAGPVRSHWKKHV